MAGDGLAANEALQLRAQVAYAVIVDRLHMGKGGGGVVKHDGGNEAAVLHGATPFDDGGRLAATRGKG